MEQKNIKDVSSEQLGLLIAEDYEEISIRRNRILSAHAELNRRINEKITTDKEIKDGA